MFQNMSFCLNDCVKYRPTFVERFSFVFYEFSSDDFITAGIKRLILFKSIKLYYYKGVAVAEWSWHQAGHLRV